MSQIVDCSGIGVWGLIERVLLFALTTDYGTTHQFVLSIQFALRQRPHCCQTLSMGLKQ